MSKLPSDDEKPARILRGALDQIVDVAHTVQEAIWEPSVRAAMRGELGPALEKFLEGKVPPPPTRAALTKALARLNKPRKGRPPKYWGPLAKRERARTRATREEAACAISPAARASMAPRASMPVTSRATANLPSTGPRSAKPHRIRQSKRTMKLRRKDRAIRRADLANYQERLAAPWSLYVKEEQQG